MTFYKFLALISICYDLRSQRLFQEHKRNLLLLICCSRHLGFHLLDNKWHFLLLILSKNFIITCFNNLDFIAFSKIMEHDVRTDIGI
jgi:hypothetical protein